MVKLKMNIKGIIGDDLRIMGEVQEGIIDKFLSIIGYNYYH